MKKYLANNGLLLRIHVFPVTFLVLGGIVSILAPFFILYLFSVSVWVALGLSALWLSYMYRAIKHFNEHEQHEIAATKANPKPTALKLFAVSLTFLHITFYDVAGLFFEVTHPFKNKPHNE